MDRGDPHDGEPREGETAGAQSGRYRLLQKIGEGGFGVDDPVLATPPSKLYRPRKYVRRHKAGVAAASAVAIALVAGLLASATGSREAIVRRELARASEHEAREQERQVDVARARSSRNARLAEARGHLERAFSANADRPDVQRASARWLARLHLTWNEAAPTPERAAQAERWRAKHEELGGEKR